MKRDKIGSARPPGALGPPLRRAAVLPLAGLLSLSLALPAAKAAHASAPPPAVSGDLKLYLPSTISPEARTRILMLRGVPSQSAPPKTLDERRARNAASDALIIKLITPILKAMGTSATSMKLGGIGAHLKVCSLKYAKKNDARTWFKPL